MQNTGDRGDAGRSGRADEGGATSTEGHGHLDETVCEVARLAVAPRPARLPKPPCFLPQVVDRWLKCNDEQSFAFARMLISQEGLLCGEWPVG